VLKENVSMRETVNDHDGFVMWVTEARGFDDEMWLGWDADMMGAAGPSVFGQRGRARRDLWLLFDDAALALVFRNLARAAGGNLASLHELANIS
jgi:hypothetical protein